MHFDTLLNPAREAMARIAPQWWDVYRDRIIVDVEPSTKDFYRFAADDGRLRLAGNSTLSLITGFRHYLEWSGAGQFSRGGSWQRVPDPLQLPESPVTRTNRYRHRYAYNFTVAGYTAPYWQWPQWDRELDILAASGSNLALVTVGAEATWLDTFTQYGYSESEALAWISQPAHQPWQWMGNLAGYGGGVSRRLVEQRAVLGRRITDRMRELGIEPVLPGFAGTVPDGFSDRNPDAVVIPQGRWAGFDQPDWLDPRGSVFADSAGTFYRQQQARLGDCRSWAADLWHEGGTHADVDPAAAAAGIAESMRRAAPDYRWLIQRWESNPLPEVLAALDSDHVLVLDLLSDHPVSPPDRHDRPWLWSSVTNFGGRAGLFGPLPEFATAGSPEPDGTDRAGGLGDTADPGSAPSGTGYLAEGVQTNPVVWSLFTDLSWRDGPVDPVDWVTDFVRSRYGGRHRRAEQAWLGLLSTVYSGPAGHPGGADSVLCAKPSLDAGRASIAAPAFLPYPPEPLEVAWRDLLAARNTFGDIDTYQYDLVDVTRQVLSNRARVLLPLLRTAFLSGDRPRFESLRAAFDELFDILEPVLATRREFLVGPWLAEARAWGADPDEADALERDARALITTWGEPAGTDPILHDYANREWAGLIGDVYRPRWASYLESLSARLRGETAATVDPTAEWVGGHRSYPSEPDGDPVAACRAVHHAITYFEGLP